MDCVCNDHPSDCSVPRESEGGDEEDGYLQQEREEDEGWVQTGMRRVLGGRKGGLLKGVAGGRAGSPRSAPDDGDALPRPPSGPGGASHWRYLAAWTRLMQARAASSFGVAFKPGCLSLYTQGMTAPADPSGVA